MHGTCLIIETIRSPEIIEKTCSASLQISAFCKTSLEEQNNHLSADLNVTNW